MLSLIFNIKKSVMANKKALLLVVTHLHRRDRNLEARQQFCAAHFSILYLPERY
jgi:heme exporter protein D